MVYRLLSPGASLAVAVHRCSTSSHNPVPPQKALYRLGYGLGRIRRSLYHFPVDAHLRRDEYKGVVALGAVEGCPFRPVGGERKGLYSGPRHFFPSVLRGDADNACQNGERADDRNDNSSLSFHIGP